MMICDLLFKTYLFGYFDLKLAFISMIWSFFLHFENDETHDEFCDPFIINLKQFTINEVSEIATETYLNDEKTGNFNFKLSIKEIAKDQNQEKKMQNEIKDDSQTDNSNDDFHYMKLFEYISLHNLILIS